jgi:hypothetical protein
MFWFPSMEELRQRHQLSRDWKLLSTSLIGVDLLLGHGCGFSFHQHINVRLMYSEVC